MISLLLMQTVIDENEVVYFNGSEGGDRMAQTLTFKAPVIDFTLRFDPRGEDFETTVFQIAEAIKPYLSLNVQPRERKTVERASPSARNEKIGRGSVTIEPASDEPPEPKPPECPWDLI